MEREKKVAKARKSLKESPDIFVCGREILMKKVGAHAERLAAIDRIESPYLRRVEEAEADGAAVELLSHAETLEAAARSAGRSGEMDLAEIRRMLRQK